VRQHYLFADFVHVMDPARNILQSQPDSLVTGGRHAFRHDHTLTTEQYNTGRLGRK
jgi:hypothetical protein